VIAINASEGKEVLLVPEESWRMHWHTHADPDVAVNVTCGTLVHQGSKGGQWVGHTAINRSTTLASHTLSNSLPNSGLLLLSIHLWSRFTFRRLIVNIGVGLHQPC
jgi:hypothetical protein